MKMRPNNQKANNQKVNSRKTRSIANKINRIWSGKLFRTYLMVDLLALAFAVVGFCYVAETRALGSFPAAQTRFFLAEDGALAWLDESYDSGVEQAIRMADVRKWEHAARTLTYRFSGSDGTWYYVPMDEFVEVVGYVFSRLLLVELAFWLISGVFGGGSARRALKPLTKMTATAQQLSVQSVQSRNPERITEAPDRLHNLEDAISSIQPGRQHVRLSTGNAELKGLEEAINSLLDRMQEAYREQSRFVSDASHELRTPIAVIQGYASMLDRWGKTNESILDESIAAIKSESEHMKALIEQLLFLARGDSGRQSIEIAEFDLSKMMHEVLEESEMIDPAHEWSLEDEGPVLCLGDEGLIKQAARILTDNATKYTPAEGRIHLRVFQNEGVPCFSVQDSGIGIDAQSVPHIFERFYRADPARDKSSENTASSTGLGLSIAKWIVEYHQGYFEVMSYPALGTRITVCLAKSGV